MEQEKSYRNVKGKTQEGKTPIRSNTNVLYDGGLSRSSDEASVMEVEPRAEVIQMELSLSTSRRRRNRLEKSRVIPINTQMVWKAYKQVKKNRGSYGVDRESIADFEKSLSKNLYKLWNRLSSGSYHPPSVLEVEIPKQDGKMRKLGIPTVSDRIAQQVLKTYLEPRLEAVFSDNSYGYRPNRSAHQAIQQVRNNVWKKSWVIDMDIKSFFDKVSHELLMKALDKHVSENWVKIYIKRWLESPIEDAQGGMRYRKGEGTPQGGVISPLLANLFLHYAFDKWMELIHPYLRFVRYADDVIIHCVSEKQAKYVLSTVRTRLADCKLELNESKTQVVYCQRKRKGNYPRIKFDFLGFGFKPRPLVDSEGEMFLGFDCAISPSNEKKIVCEIKRTNFHRWAASNLSRITKVFNPRIRGWINYYGKFKINSLCRVFKRFNYRLISWAINRYKRFKGSRVRAGKWLRNLANSHPDLFYHWKYPYFR